MAVDKQSIFILIFVVLFVFAAAILMTNTIPTIFQTNQQVNTTNFLLQQRIALTEQQQHEDSARDVQAVKILSNVSTQLKGLKHNITQLMIDSETRSNKSFAQRDLMMQKIDNQTNQNNIILANLNKNSGQNNLILANLDNKSEDHARQSVDMRILANKIANIANDTRDALIIYGENSISKFDKILQNQINLSNKIFENQIKISNKLDMLLNNTN